MRIQLDNTKEMIEKNRDAKDRELARIRAKFDDDKRKETEKYQFEYEKLRDEIALFNKKLG